MHLVVCLLRLLWADMISQAVFDVITVLEVLMMFYVEYYSVEIHLFFSSSSYN